MTTEAKISYSAEVRRQDKAAVDASVKKEKMNKFTFDLTAK
jgi:acyl-CoA thioesterase FadM